MAADSLSIGKPNPEQQDHLATAALRREFPLFLFEEFDSTFPNLGWIIGMKSDYPEELFRRVGAAGVSVFLGSKSVDYICKRYTNAAEYECGENRLDKEVSNWLVGSHKLFLDGLSAITNRDEQNFGKVLFEWTLLRFPFAAKHMVSCANRGSIFEVTALARMTVEQFAWAWCIDDATDPDAIDKTSATKAIGVLSKEEKYLGKLYGWLSEYAHWSPKAHVRAMIEHKGKLGIQFASSLYKAQGYILIAVLTVLACRVLVKKRAELLRQNSGGADTIQKLKAVDHAAQIWAEKIATLQPDPTLKNLALILAS